MAPTNGLGYKYTTASEKPDIQDTDSTYTPQYMVPRGIDLILNRNINKATIGVDTATNIVGNVKLHPFTACNSPILLKEFIR
jgi:hypothetical protein